MCMKHVQRDGDSHPDMQTKTDANSKKETGWNKTGKWIFQRRRQKQTAEIKLQVKRYKDRLNY